MASTWDKLFAYDTLVHAISGACGSVTAMTAFYPLDTIRSRLQVEESRKSKNTLVMMCELVKEEGVESLYRGLGPVLTSICCSNFVYFYTFHGLRAIVSSDGKTHSALKDLSLGAVAGIVNVVLTTPLWVVNTRLKMQGAKLHGDDKNKLKHYPHYDGILDAFSKISSTEGARALWSGVMPSMMLVSNPAIQFMVYEFLKRETGVDARGRKTLDSRTVFIIGALAKSVSTILTYPLQILQSKLRYGSDELKKLNLIEMFLRIVRLSGIQGLYKGLEAKLLQTVLAASLMFVCYEKIAAFVFNLLKGKTSRSH